MASNSSQVSFRLENILNAAACNVTFKTSFNWHLLFPHGSSRAGAAMTQKLFSFGQWCNYHAQGRNSHTIRAQRAREGGIMRPQASSSSSYLRGRWDFSTLPSRPAAAEPWCGDATTFVKERCSKIAAWVFTAALLLLIELWDWCCPQPAAMQTAKLKSSNSKEEESLIAF